MVKKHTKYSNPALTQIFDDLDAYRDFCRDFGYKFDESDLYNMKKYPFQQFNKFRTGKRAKDQWSIDKEKMA
jgi:hypothetical protein